VISSLVITLSLVIILIWCCSAGSFNNPFLLISLFEVVRIDIVRNKTTKSLAESISNIIMNSCGSLSKGINQLPVELLNQIFLFLEFHELVHDISLVCDLWRRITHLRSSYTSDILWINKCFQRWNMWRHIHRIMDTSERTITEHDDEGLLIRVDSVDQMRAIQPKLEQEYPFQIVGMTSQFMGSSDDDDDSESLLREEESFWYRVFRERYEKDGRVFRMLMNKTMWNRRLEVEILNECTDMDVFEYLKKTVSIPNMSMTYLYYANKLIKKLHNEQMYHKWQRFIRYCDDPNAKVLMIDGALMISKLKSVDFNVQESVLNPLNAMVSHVKSRANELNLDISYEHEQLFEVVNEEMYVNCELRGDLGPLDEMSNRFIDGTIQHKAGFPIMLCAMYQYICYHAFGILLLPIGAPGRFLLKWDKGAKYIDAFENGAIMSQNRCIECVTQYVESESLNEKQIIDQFLSKPSPNARIFSRMLANIIESSPNRYASIGDYEVLSFLQVSLLLDPNNYYHRILRIERALNQPDMLQAAQDDLQFLFDNSIGVGRVYTHDAAGRLLAKLQMIVERAQLELRNEPERPNRTYRNTDIQYYPGQQMKHRKYGYRGVIFGYDPKCMMSEQWIQHMGVSLRQRNNPFYHVLVHGQDRPSQITYVCAENIIASELHEPIEHSEIGRYFEQFNEVEGRYIPNRLTKYMYPDTAI